MSAKGLIIGAPRSGSGKTSVTIGLLRAFARRGIAVAAQNPGRTTSTPASTPRPPAGPASISTPGRCTRRCSPASPERRRRRRSRHRRKRDGPVRRHPSRQGPLGLGGRPRAALSPAGRCWCSTSPASRRRQPRVAKGFATYDPDVRIAGVVLNRVASERHRRLAADAIEAIGLPVVGAIMRDPTLSLPERHLGLVQASEHAALEEFIERMADVMEKSLDLDAILSLAAPFAAGRRQHGPRAAAARPAHRARRGCRLHLPLSACRGRMAARRARSWCRSRRWPTSRRRTIATPAGCRAAIPSCTPAGSRPRETSAPAWSVSPRRGPSTASAAASWCSARRWKMPTARRPRNARPARPLHQLRQAQDEPRLPPGAAESPTARWAAPARPSAATSSTTRSSPRRATTSRSPTSSTARASRSAPSAAAAATSPAPSSTPSRGLRAWTPALRTAETGRRHRRLRRLLHAACPPAGLGLPEVDFANALWAAPVAGAIVGVCAGAAFAAAIWLSLPPSLAAIVALGRRADGDRQPARGRRRRRRRRLRRRQHARAQAGDHEGQPQRHVRRRRAGDDAARALGGDGRARRAELRLRRAGRRACGLARADPGLHEPGRAGPARRTFGQHRQGPRQRRARRGRPRPAGAAPARARHAPSRR